MSRCMQTAEILGEPYSITAHSVPALVDIDYSDWQGKSFLEVQGSAPEAFARWRSRPDVVEIPGGETLHNVAGRVVAGLQAISSRHAQEAVLLIGHDSVNRLLILVVLDLPLSRYWCVGQEPVWVSVVQRDDRGTWTAATINETAHLGSLGEMRQNG